MKIIKYFLQFLFVIIFFSLFKILGLNISSALGGKLFEKIGPLFRSKKLIHSNLKKAFPDISLDHLNGITKMMWNNYGRVFAEYMFIKKFREDRSNKNIIIEGQEILEDIKKKNKSVIFISGHLSNFELMAMYIEKSGIKLSAIYRPLNNIFLNKIMERIRKKYICKYQIKKGIGGMKKLMHLKKLNYSTALMIDQRVSQGIRSNFFNQKALTTTIPAQLVKKFKIPIVPIFIERINKINFKIVIKNPITFDNEETTKTITDKLNLVLEKMISYKPELWIWSHNRWK
ncbi:lysophospholipid acyltransferase family protein [Candidatus Pelagibacter sp.]|nr:lysophospholipid acyltransferase family protein [Candidatus Pelagibacter bacterium]MDC0900655.1 lysophospholipid acyltransferase family protein [Candidatus Pelagibacter sp.]MDC1069705.1 lysophospholipid acyltransferase family protein [Candidatus Pelagibacter sp.]